MSSGFWTDKTVLVTGHTGFKGGWLCLWLQSLGARVVGYALAPATIPSLFEAADVGHGMASLTGDVRDLARIKAVIAEHDPQIVFHLAAQPLVLTSYQDPLETYSTNVMGTAHVLEAVRAARSTRVIVCVTSDKCYENQDWVWGYRESDHLGGYDPYSSSKGCAELVIAAYQRSFFPAEDYGRHRAAVASVRAGNVIGGGDWAADRLVPDFIRAAAHGEPLIVRSPQAVRPWQHVLEPLRGYLTLAEKLWSDGPRYGGPWNFGPDDADTETVASVADLLTASWGDGAVWRADASSLHPHEANYLKLDCSKAKAKLGWHPQWGLRTALDATVHWHKAHRAGQDMRRFSLDQLRNYAAQVTK